MSAAAGAGAGGKSASPSQPGEKTGLATVLQQRTAVEMRAQALRRYCKRILITGGAGFM